MKTNLSTEENQCLYDKCKKYLIILQKADASEAGVIGMNQVKSSQSFSEILKNLTECKVKSQDYSQ